MYRAGPAHGPNPLLSTANSGPRNQEGKGPPRAGGEKNLRAAESARGEEPGGQERTLGATMRRSSKKSSSSATAGNAQSPDPSPPAPCVLVSWSGRELRGARTGFGFGLRDSIRDLLPREDQISRRRRAELHFSGPTLWCLVSWCNRGVGLEGRAWGSID
jgi:hypothetical protein